MQFSISFSRKMSCTKSQGEDSSENRALGSRLCFLLCDNKNPRLGHDSGRGLMMKNSPKFLGMSPQPKLLHRPPLTTHNRRGSINTPACTPRITWVVSSVLLLASTKDLTAGARRGVRPHPATLHTLPCLVSLPPSLACIPCTSP